MRWRGRPLLCCCTLLAWPGRSAATIAAPEGTDARGRHRLGGPPRRRTQGVLTVVGITLAVVAVVVGVRWAAASDSGDPVGDREQPPPSRTTPPPSPTPETSTDPGPTFTTTAQTAEPAGS
ncbi:MAG: hypothetical protein H0U77_02935 [Nocardioidaceae bacterium]|nr:hypothetical protein [Nocardioidaceae bacterium]